MNGAVRVRGFARGFARDFENVNVSTTLDDRRMGTFTIVDLKMTKQQCRAYLLGEGLRGKRLRKRRKNVKNSFKSVQGGRFMFKELRQRTGLTNSRKALKCDLLSGTGDIGKHEYRMTAFANTQNVDYAYATGVGSKRVLQFFECKTIVTSVTKSTGRLNSKQLIDQLVQLECSCRGKYDYEHHYIFIIFPQLHIQSRRTYSSPLLREYRDGSGWHTYTNANERRLKGNLAKSTPPAELDQFLRGFCVHLPKKPHGQDLLDQWWNVRYDDNGTHFRREFTVVIKKNNRPAVNRYGMRFNWNQQRIFSPAVGIMAQMWFGVFFFDNHIKTNVSLDIDATRDRIERESSVRSQRTPKGRVNMGVSRRPRVRLGPLIAIPCVLPPNVVAGVHTKRLHEAVMRWSKQNRQTFGTLEKCYGHSSRISTCLNRARMIRDLRIAPTLSTATMRSMYSAYEQAKTYEEAATHYTARAMNRIVNRIIATTAKQTQSLSYLNIDDIATFSADSDRYRWSDELITEGLRLLRLITADL